MGTNQYVKHVTGKKLLQQLVYSLRRKVSTLWIGRIAAQVGEECGVNHYSKVTENTYLSYYVSLNGLEIAGKGRRGDSV